MKIGVNERHLRRILADYLTYYHSARNSLPRQPDLTTLRGTPARLDMRNPAFRGDLGGWIVLAAGA
jgi:hypothetical protein